jgi:hypothetical protein
MKGLTFNIQIQYLYGAICFLPAVFVLYDKSLDRKSIEFVWIKWTLSLGVSE